MASPNCPNSADALSDADIPIPIPNPTPAEPARAGLVARRSMRIATQVMYATIPMLYIAAS